MIEGIDLFGLSIPSRFVGGDYFDIINKGNELLLVIADVVGKGIPSALIMANIQSALKVLSKMDISLIEIIQNLNLLVYENTSIEKFITLFIGKLDLKTKTFTYINAGHNPPIFFNKKSEQILFLKEGGLILGLFDYCMKYSIGQIKVSEGDIILFYTDGITEATNLEDVEFGENRLCNLILNLQNLSSKEICKGIVEEIKKFTGSSELLDDLTLLVLKIIN